LSFSDRCHREKLSKTIAQRKPKTRRQNPCVSHCAAAAPRPPRNFLLKAVFRIEIQHFPLQSDFSGFPLFGVFSNFCTGGGSAKLKIISTLIRIDPPSLRITAPGGLCITRRWVHPPIILRLSPDYPPNIPRLSPDDRPTIPPLSPSDLYSPAVAPSPEYPPTTSPTIPRVSTEYPRLSPDYPPTTSPTIRRLSLDYPSTIPR
jgi:hypothetical protein